MQLFFQSFLATTKAIKSFIKEKKKVMITYNKNSLSFAIVSKLSEEEMYKSCKDFFLFIRKNATQLDLETLPMGERHALIETMSVLELYIQSLLPPFSRVRNLLEDEIFSLKLGYSIPRTYIEKKSEDVRFIKDNDLAKIFFYHGIKLTYSKKNGIGFPVQTSKCVKQTVFFNNLKKYSLSDIDKYYYKGEFLFSLDRKGKLIQSLKVKHHALVISDTFLPFITYASGFLPPTFELYHRKKDCFIAVHDGDGAVYRFGFHGKGVISPDKFVYGGENDFNKIHFTVSKDHSKFCIDSLLKEQISSKEEMVEHLLKVIDADNEFVTPLTSQNKMLSYAYLPKLLIKVIKGELYWKNLFTPWKLKQIDFKKLETSRGALSKKSFS